MHKHDNHNRTTFRSIAISGGHDIKPQRHFTGGMLPVLHIGKNVRQFQLQTKK